MENRKKSQRKKGKENEKKRENEHIRGEIFCGRGSLTSHDLAWLGHLWGGTIWQAWWATRSEGPDSAHAMAGKPPHSPGWMPPFAHHIQYLAPL